MAVYADLGPIDYFRTAGASWRAVGWLGKGREFPQGEVSPAFFDRLCELLVKPWQRFGFLGFHGCEFCPLDNPRGLRFEQLGHRRNSGRSTNARSRRRT